MKASKVASLGEKIMIKDLQERLGYNKDGDTAEKVKLNPAPEEKRQCIFCGNKKQLFNYRGKYYCYNCYLELQKL